MHGCVLRAVLGAGVLQRVPAGPGTLVPSLLPNACVTLGKSLRRSGLGSLSVKHDPQSAVLANDPVKHCELHRGLQSRDHAEPSSSGHLPWQERNTAPLLCPVPDNESCLVSVITEQSFPHLFVDCHVLLPGVLKGAGDAVPPGRGLHPGSTHLQKALCFIWLLCTV